MPRVPLTHAQRTAPSTPVGQPISAAAAGGLEAQALQGAGNAVTDIAERLGEQQDASFTASASADIARQVAERLPEWQREAGEGAANYTETVRQNLEDMRSHATRQAPSRRAEHLLADRLDRYEASILGNAQEFELRARDALTLREFEGSVENTLIAVGNGSLDPELAVEQLTGTRAALEWTLPPTTFSQLRGLDVRRGVYDAYYAGLDPANVLSAAGQGGGSPRVIGEVSPASGASHHVATIVNAADAVGENPVNALAIAIGESGLDPSAQNPNSTAHGYFQTIDSTWAQLGGTAANRNDPQTQARLGVAYMAGSREELTRFLGREPELWEIYTAHLFGIGGAREILAAAPDEPTADVVRRMSPNNADEIVRNHGFEDETVRQTLQRLAGIVRRNAERAASMLDGEIVFTEPGGNPAAADPQFTNLPIERQRALINRAQDEINRQRTEQRVAFESAWADELTMIQAGMPYDGPAVDLQDALASFEDPGPVWREIQEWRRFGEQSQALGQMHDDEMDEFLRNWEPAGENAANESDRFRVASQLVEAHREQREDDAMGYVIRHDPQTTQAFEAAFQGDQPDPEAVRRAVGIGLAAQRDLDTERPRVMTAAHATLWQRSIRSAENGQALLDAVDAVHASYGPEYGFVAINELIDAGALTGPTVALIDLPPGVARVELAEAIMTPEAELEEALPASFKQSLFDEALQEHMNGLRTSLPPGNIREFNAHQSAVRLLGLYRAARGAEWQDAINSAYDDVIGDQYRFVENNGATIRIPRTMPADQLADVERALGNDASLRTALIDEFADRIDPAIELDSSFLPEGADPEHPEIRGLIRGQYVDSVLDDLVLTTAFDESGVYLVDAAERPVIATTEEGLAEPVFLSWEALAEIGRGIETPALPRGLMPLHGAFGVP